MGNLIGKWGGTNLYNILLTNEQEYVHPNDWELLKNYKYIRSLHLCTNVDIEYITVIFSNTELRIKKNLFFPLDLKPKFKPLEKVKFLNSKNIIEFGIIKGIYWHNNDRKFYYDVEVNNKIKGRRYFDEDLESNE